MISLDCKENKVYLKKILTMFFVAFLVLATCNNTYAAGGNDSSNPPVNSATTNDPVGLVAKACSVYKAISPILSFVILIVVIMTALAALFGKLSMAVVITVMISAIIITQAPKITALFTTTDISSCTTT